MKNNTIQSFFNQVQEAIHSSKDGLFSLDSIIDTINEVKKSTVIPKFNYEITGTLMHNPLSIDEISDPIVVKADEETSSNIKYKYDPTVEKSPESAKVINEYTQPRGHIYTLNIGDIPTLTSNQMKNLQENFANQSYKNIQQERITEYNRNSHNDIRPLTTAQISNLAPAAPIKAFTHNQPLNIKHHIIETNIKNVKHNASSHPDGTSSLCFLVPGVKKEDIKITATSSNVTIEVISSEREPSYKITTWKGFNFVPFKIDIKLGMHKHIQSAFLTKGILKVHFFTSPMSKVPSDPRIITISSL